MSELPLRRARWARLALVLMMMAATLTACSFSTGNHGPTGVTSTPNAEGTETAPNVGFGTAYTPQQLRDAYGVTPLYDKGFRGKGQTVIIIDSFGSPTLQDDLKVFDQQFGLPDVNLQVLAPIGTVPFDSGNAEMSGWQQETTLDVETVHAIAPEANIIVLTSPVDETEGVQGLPEFLRLEQYAVDHQLGSIISQSFGASEASLSDAAGQAEIARWDAFYKQATTQDHITVFSASGDNGAADCLAVDTTQGGCSTYTTSASTGFPADNPWVVAVGGTTLTENGGAFQEVAWSSNGGASGGGFSKFYSIPSYQTELPASALNELNGRRGVPDVAASADPAAQPAIYVAGRWTIIGGTSAATPLWAGVMAVANQVAGRPLGYINPALYKIAATSAYTSAFRDVTSGDNTFDGGSVTVQGYESVAGWDAVTGLGSPNAANLIPLLVQNTPA
jgi:subtilase family serine protease